MDIGAVRRRTGLSAAALHHYERVGLIHPIGRDGLRRQYDASVVEVLAAISICQQSGFSLEEIGELLARRRRASWKQLAQHKIEAIDEQVRNLQRAREGLVHAIGCPSPDIMRCHHFKATLDAVYPEILDEA